MEIINAHQMHVRNKKVLFKKKKNSYLTSILEGVETAPTSVKIQG